MKNMLTFDSLIRVFEKVSISKSFPPNKFNCCRPGLSSVFARGKSSIRMKIYGVNLSNLKNLNDYVKRDMKRLPIYTARLAIGTDS